MAVAPLHSLLPVLIVVLLLQESTAQTFTPNISYGPDPQQTLALYLPKNGTSHGLEKLVLLIHGGGWSSGKKEDMFPMMSGFAHICPSCASASLGYRLGSSSSPGYPKQLEDIQLVLNYLKNLTNGNIKFALVGGSAGGHLSMLYGYKYGPANNVKAIVNIVGPSDFTDPKVAYNPVLNMIIFAFIGPYVYCQKPELYNETSPVTWIKEGVPPTISFLGKTDQLIPVSQGTILKSKLDGVGVLNELTYYEGGHMVGWTKEDFKDMWVKVKKFFDSHF